jgi:uncharacterized membrane-anchored protein
MRALIKYAVALFLAAITGVSFAQTQATKDELKAAVQEANAALIKGPHTIEVLDQASFALPASAGFVPAPAAIRYLRALGNSVDERSLVGLIVPQTNGEQWIAVLTFVKSGYVRDDDARNWKPDEILKNLRDGTEQSNASRKEKGLPELEVTGWAEAPAYDANTHRLIWSAVVRAKDQGAATQDDVNYRTIALGRNGYLSLTMASSLASLALNKPTANALLADISYLDGKRYADFNASTDHIAEYGLAALIAGVAVKKLGLLAVIAAFAAKFFKIGLIALLAFSTKIKALFKRKPKTAGSSAPRVDFVPPSVFNDPNSEAPGSEHGHASSPEAADTHCQPQSPPHASPQAHSAPSDSSQPPSPHG